MTDIINGTLKNNKFQSPTASQPNVVQAEKAKTPTIEKKQAGVRQSYVNMGFDDSQIGYDNGAVTYNNKQILQQPVIKNDIAYAPEDSIRKGAVDYLTNNGYKGVRQSLNEQGVSDDRIGWDDGYVTIDGQKKYKPQYNVGGTTYGTNDEVKNLANDALTMSGDVVAARGYVSGKGYSGSVGWDGENVLVGGRAVKPVYVRDGTAYVRKSELDPLISSFENDNGIKKNSDIVLDNDKRYSSKRDDALSRLVDRDEFSWNPNTDDDWRRHVDVQTELADDAMRRVLNENNTSITGASGAVLSDAFTARDNYLRQLAEDEIAYRQLAGDEYKSETNRLRENFSDIYAASDNDFQKRYTAYGDDYSRMYNSDSDNKNEEWKWRDYESNIARSALDNENLRLQNENASIQNKQSQYDYIRAIVSDRGEFIEEDEEFIPWLKRYRDEENGGYKITPTQAEIAYTRDIAYANAAGQYNAYNDFNK